MKIVKDIFVKRPMKWQYYLSLLLEIPIVFWSIRNIPQDLFGWIITLVYIISSVRFYFVKFKDTNWIFTPIFEQWKKEYNPNFCEYLLNLTLVLTKYILMGIFYQIMLQELFNEITIPGVGISIYSLPMLISMSLILSDILFNIFRLPPIILFGIIALPFIIFSLVGVEKTILGWTFISLILVSMSFQFLNEDMKLLVVLVTLRIQ